jgi:hypothetical protein
MIASKTREGVRAKRQDFASTTHVVNRYLFEAVIQNCGHIGSINDVVLLAINQRGDFGNQFGRVYVRELFVGQ